MNHIYFTIESIEWIKSGKQTQTIRTIPKSENKITDKYPWGLGTIQEIRERRNRHLPIISTGIKIKIMQIQRKRINDLTSENALKNGCKNLQDFLNKYDKINNSFKAKDNREIWIIDFIKVSD